MQQYRLNEAVGRPFDTALTAARMIYSGVFDKYPSLKFFSFTWEEPSPPWFADSIGIGT
jgi:hypothetical protein